MVSDADLFCSLALMATGALAIVWGAGRSAHESSRALRPPARRQRLIAAVLRRLDRLADVLNMLDVSANAITLFRLCVAAVAGVLLGLGHFGIASTAMVLASFGDAVDGLVARKSGTTSLSGALLDASVDRYEEFFFLAGLSVYLRSSLWLLLVTFFALAGSFMVSYGSAKAEGIGMAVPPGAMRRTDRCVTLCTGTTLTTPFAWLTGRGWIPAWAAHLPLVSALVLVAVVANVSAILRMRALGQGSLPERSPALAAKPQSSFDSTSSTRICGPS